MAKNQKIKKNTSTVLDETSINQDKLVKIEEVSTNDVLIVEDIVKTPTRAIQLFKKTDVYGAVKWDDHDGLSHMRTFLEVCIQKDTKRFSDHFLDYEKWLSDEVDNNELFKPALDSVLLIDKLSKKVKDSPFMRILEYWLKNADELQQMSYLAYLMTSFHAEPEKDLPQRFAPYFIAYTLLERIDKYYGGSTSFKFDRAHNLKFDQEGVEFDEQVRILEMIQDAYYMIVKRKFQFAGVDLHPKYSKESIFIHLNYIDRLLKMSTDIDNLIAAAAAYRTYRLFNGVVFVDEEIEVNKKINDANKKLGNPHFSFLHDAYYAKARSEDGTKDIEYLNLAYKEVESIDIANVNESIVGTLLKTKISIKKDLGLYDDALKDIDSHLKNKDTDLPYYYLEKAEILFLKRDYKKAETVLKKIEDGITFYSGLRDELLLKIYKQLGKPLEQYQTLMKLDNSYEDGWSTVIEDVVDLIPDLVEQLESYKDQSLSNLESSRHIEWIEGGAIFEKESFLELLFDHQRHFKTLNGLTDKDSSKGLSIDYDIILQHMVFIKRLCDANGSLAKTLSIPSWSTLCDEKNISKNLVGVFEKLSEYFKEDGYFDINKLMVFGSYGLDNSKIEFLRNHYLEEIAIEMNKYSWTQELIDDTSFYNSFKDFGYSIFDAEEHIHNHQTKPEIVDLLVALYDIKENDVIIDPACGTGRIFEKIISSMNESGKRIPYLYGFEEIYRVASFHHMKSMLLGNEKHIVKMGDMQHMEEVPYQADYVFFDPPLDDDEPLNSFFETIKFTLKGTGKVVIIVPTELLSSKRETWSTLISENLIDTIVNLPKQYDRMGFGETIEDKVLITPHPSSIIILDRSRDISSKIRFFDASDQSRKMRKDYENDHQYIISILNDEINSSLVCLVGATDVTENNYDLSLFKYLKTEDRFKELSESADFDYEEVVRRKIEEKLSDFAHLMNTSTSNLYNKIEPLLKYLEANAPKNELLYKETQYDHLKDRLVQEQINSVRDHSKVLSNSILTMKKLNSIGQDSFNPELGDIRKEIVNIINNSGEKILVKHKLGSGMDKDYLKIDFDKSLLEQALLTQIENSCRVNKGMDDLMFVFKYNIRSGFLEVRYSNNGKAASPEIASTMFTDQYHSGYGEGGGFGQKLIAKVLSFHKVGNLEGRVRMNSDAEKTFGFTMSLPLPAKNQR